MSSPYAKRRRITPWSTVSAGAMGSSFNKKQAAAVSRLSRRVKHLEKDEEAKIKENALSFDIDSTGEVPATGQLCIITQGVGDGQRIGRTVECTSLQVRCSATFNPGASAGGNSSVVHIFVVLDRNCSGAAAAVTDVFTGTNMATAMRNLTNITRFKILHHWEHAYTSPAGATTAYCQVASNWETYLKFKKRIRLDFDASAGLITDLTTGNIFLIAGSDGNSDDLVSIVGNARLTFYG